MTRKEGEIEKENVVNNEAEEEGEIVDDQDVQYSVPIVDLLDYMQKMENHWFIFKGKFHFWV